MIGYDPNDMATESEQVHVQTMILYRYFKPSDSLPDPSGPLSASVGPGEIKEANEAVRSVTRGSKPRGRYAKFILEQHVQVAIGE